MRCIFCEAEIDNHRPDLHTFRVDDQRSVDVCDACERRFVHWHGDKLARMFPTRAMKRAFPKRRG